LGILKLFHVHTYRYTYVYVYVCLFVCFTETKSRRIAKRPWSPNEDNAFVKHFHISKGHLATKAECELCKTAEDPVLRERMAQNIRHFVRNRGLMLKKKSS